MRDALARIGRFEDPPGRADRAGRRAAALPQQARVLVRRGRGGRAGARLPPPRPLRPDRRRDPRHPRLRARGRAARGGQGLVPRGGPVGLGPAQPAGAAAQPGGARGPAHRPAPGARGDEPGLELPRRRAGRAGARRQLPLDARRGRGRDHARGRDRGREGRRPPRGGAVRPALAHLAGRLLPDQHRDGRAPLRRRGRAGRPERARARARPVLRHRHDRARAGARRRRGLGRRDRRGGGGRRDRERPPQRGGQRELLRRRRAAGDAAAARAVGPARRGGGRPAARRAVAEGRAPRARGGGGADRLRVVQPDHAGAERAPDGGRRLRAEDRAAGRHVPADAAHRVRGAAGANA